MEVDPLVMRALHHLVSRKPESSEKLRQMLFESLGREYVPPKLKTEPTAAPKIQRSKSGDSADSMDEDDADMGAETDCSTDIGGVKNEDTMDADDFAFDMGISCVICRQFDVSSNNQLLECKECRSLYHQLCHKPAIKHGQDDNFVCNKCSGAKKSDSKKSSKLEEGGSSKKESSDATKKSESKAEKSSESKKSSDLGKEKKLSKSEKKMKEKTADKHKGDSDKEKEKVKKHKDSKSDTKSESSLIKKEKDVISSGKSETTVVNQI